MRSVLKSIFVAAPLALAACGDADVPAGATGSAATTRSQASSDADLVRAVTLGDGEAPADLRFRLGARPEPGADVEVSLALSVKQALASGRIRFSGRSGLGLATDAAEFVFGPVEAGQVLPYAVVVRPAPEGIGELVALLEGETESGPVRAEYAVPVITVAAP